MVFIFPLSDKMVVKDNLHTQSLDKWKVFLDRTSADFALDIDQNIK